MADLWPGGPSESDFQALLQRVLDGSLTMYQVLVQIRPAGGGTLPGAYVQLVGQAQLDGRVTQAQVDSLLGLATGAVAPPESLFKAWDQLMHVLSDLVPKREKVMLRAVRNMQSAVTRAQRKAGVRHG